MLLAEENKVLSILENRISILENKTLDVAISANFIKFSFISLFILILLFGIIVSIYSFNLIRKLNFEYKEILEFRKKMDFQLDYLREKVFLEKDKSINEIRKETDEKIKLLNFWNKAIACLQNNDYEKAISYFQEIISLNPKFDEAYYYLGIAYVKTLNYENALSSYEKVIELNPKNKEVYYNIACLYSLQGKKFEMLRYLGKAIKYNINCKNMAKTDRDFENFHLEKEFKKLIT